MTLRFSDLNPLGRAIIITVAALTFGVAAVSFATSYGALYAWGADHSGQLGDGKTTPEFSPVRITPPSGVTYRLLASSGSTSYGVTTAGNVYAWGAGGVGQIGNGTTAGSLTPVKVASDATGISGTAFDVVIAIRPHH